MSFLDGATKLSFQFAYKISVLSPAPIRLITVSFLQTNKEILSISQIPAKSPKILACQCQLLDFLFVPRQ
ncbi:hypothetical protein BOSEA31B_13790 [Hyphomicrobiales bacterium]|nr:hypothetical protein BOSEA31B_13790 [Hyphomicrobiales bacterium]CAH1699560.1 hypothetical protein BOSEA1005_12613 [Hyphomicrobiales bacterium]CAI0343348.1 hypothetical protein BO1005MUT1_220147 [Hyphomicrobiales bacterium]